MNDCASLVTEARGPRPVPRGRRRGRRRRAPGRLAIAAALLGFLLGATPAPPAATTSPSPADLERRLEKAENTLDRAEGAVRGRDPGRVSLLLKRIDDELGIFEVNARLQPLASSVEGARAAARRNDLPAALREMQRARALYPPLADFAVLQQAEEASRAAVRAAQGGDPDICLAAIDRFDAALRPALLVKRVAEARQAIARTRTAMVRGDMKGGAAELRTARRAFDGLRYAGELSRAQFGLRVGADLLDLKALMAAREQVQKALHSLRAAADLGAGGPDAAEVVRARDAVESVWRRILKPRNDDTRILLDVARTVEAIRARQT